ncbi:MAG: hypothetical protein CL678_00325 [Bdellovibrionaceae bacterium]|nr:hypothetical protein [Pseudobdellovibrionaceae bacterium]
MRGRVQTTLQSPGGSSELSVTADWALSETGSFSVSCVSRADGFVAGRLNPPVRWSRCNAAVCVDAAALAPPHWRCGRFEMRLQPSIGATRAAELSRLRWDKTPWDAAVAEADRIEQSSRTPWPAALVAALYAADAAAVKAGHTLVYRTKPPRVVPPGLAEVFGFKDAVLVIDEWLKLPALRAHARAALTRSRASDEAVRAFDSHGNL